MAPSEQEGGVDRMSTNELAERTDSGSIAFEVGYHAESPDVLWRLNSLRHWTDGNKLQARHIKWFASREAAEQHAAWIQCGRGEVVSIDEYRKT